MLVQSSVRMTSFSIRSVKVISICFGHVLKKSVIFPPKLNPGNPLVVCIAESRQHSTKFVPSDIEDIGEKLDTKYLYQKLSRKENIDRLKECVGCNEFLAARLLKDYPAIRYISSKEISRRIKFLNEYGISLNRILENYMLIGLDDGEVKEKVAILTDLGINNSDLAAPLFRYPLDRLKKAANWAKDKYPPRNKTKISILCELLDCSPLDIFYAASVHTFLQTVPFERMIATLEILIAEGVPPSKILTDMWVVRYRTETVKSRIIHARNGGIEQFKTWMVRCTEKILETTIRRQAEKRNLLGPHNDSTVDYISSRLNISREEAQSVIERHPQLRGVGAAKLANTFDFLLGCEESGAKFKQVQIWNSSRILCHSLDTMRARLVRLRALGFEPRNPVILYKSKRKFEKFAKKLEEKALEERELEEKAQAMANMEVPAKEGSEASQRDVR